MRTRSRHVPPSRHRRPARGLPPVYAGLGLLYAVILVLSGFNLVDDFAWYGQAAQGARFAFGVFGVVAAVRAARMPALPPRLRQAWGAVAACFATLVVTVPLLVLFDEGVSSSWDDATHVVFVVALLIALQRFPLAPTGGRERLKTAIDAATVMVGGSVVFWFTAIGPMVDRRHGFSPEILVSAAVYPIGDLLLLFSVARALLRGADETAQRPLRLLTAGTLVLLVGDATHAYLSGHDGTEMPASWQFVAWITADALLAAAAVSQRRAGFAAATEPRRVLGVGRYLPFFAVAVAQLLMLAQAGNDRAFFPWGGLALGGAALSVLVLYRQTLVQRESDERALTDGLTGLANRTMFRQTSYRALARGRRMSILVIDMNGFKEINDTLGHKSGDRVLVEFAEVLRRCVAPPNLPVRLGGDEFAVVLPDVARPEDAYEVAGRIAAALGPIVVDGRLITLAASIGVAVTEPGRLTHDEIVHRADLAMYRAKSLGPDTRWAIWQESLEPATPAAPVPVAA
ncbi:GGDEF domain-containing protein [Actinoplanes sp. NPDC049802]|uniref:GGDEF domain-containing protein n=1 Tax=Actinoplanes sp. NPDC049802 TaxID=3154742 RepID=UPI0033FADD55